MKRSLTLGEALIASAIQSFVVDMGKKALTKIEKDAKTLGKIPDGIEAMVDRAVRYDHLELWPAGVRFEDPWDLMVEKLIGHAYAKNGMSTYFILYILAIDAYFRVTEMQSEREIFLIENKRSEIEAILNRIADDLHCSINDLPVEMAKHCYPAEKVEAVRSWLEMAPSIKEQTEKVKKSIEKIFTMAHVTYGRLSVFEESFKFPRRFYPKEIALHFLGKMFHAASPKDFELVRSEALSFLAVPQSANTIALLGQGKRI